LLWLLAAPLWGVACSRERSSASNSGKSEVAETRSRHANQGAQLPSVAVGQWVRYSIDYRKGQHSELTYRVLSSEGPALWLEVVSGDPNAGTVVQLLTRLGPQRTAESTDLLGVRLQMPRGLVKQLDAADLASSRASYLDLLDLLFAFPPAAHSVATRSVPAGDFDGALGFQRPTRIEGQTLDATLWQHSAVPITGLVELESPEVRVQCLAFGYAGAQSQMRARPANQR